MRIYDERQNVQDCELYGSAHIRPQSHLKALLVTIGLFRRLRHRRAADRRMGFADARQNQQLVSRKL
jgi:hypothetical protein